MPPRPAHRTQFGRDYRRVAATRQDDATGTGSGSSAPGGDTASYWVLEEDGTSKWTLEEANGFWITEEST